MFKWYWLAAMPILAEVGLRLRHGRDVDQWMDNGLRPGLQPARPLASAAKRIVVLGDSIPYGHGVEEHLAYPSILAEMIEDANSEHQIIVVNAGIRGQTVLHGWARLERHVLRWQPHLVIVAFGLNDAHLGRSPVDAWREHDFWRRRTSLHRVPRWSHIYRTVAARIQSQRYRRFLSSTDPAPNRSRVSAVAFRACLRSISGRLCSRCTVILATTTPLAHFALADFPAQRKKRQLALYGEYNGIVKQVALSEGAALADVGQSFKGGNPGAMYAPDGIHLTSEGQRTVAGSLFPLVEDALFAKTQAR